MRLISNLIYFVAVVLILMSIFKNAKNKKIKTNTDIGMGSTPNNCNYHYLRDNNDMEEGESLQEFNDWSMEENRKTITPFEQGGYDMEQGNSFNDSNNGDLF